MLAYLERLRLIGFSTVVGVLSAQIIGSTGEDRNLADGSHSLEHKENPLRWFMHVHVLNANGTLEVEAPKSKRQGGQMVREVKTCRTGPMAVRDSKTLLRQ